MNNGSANRGGLFPSTKSKAKLTAQEFGCVYESGFSKTVNFLKSRWLHDDEAREFAQAAWTRGWERLYQLRDERRLVSWVNEIARRLVQSDRRRDGRLVHFSAADQSPIAPATGAVAIDVRRALGQLPPKKRRLLELKYDVGLSGRELANALSISRGDAVYVALMRARRATQVELGPSYQRKKTFKKGGKS